MTKLEKVLQRKMEENQSRTLEDKIGSQPKTITFDDFKSWLKGFIQGKRYKLPDRNDWNVIINIVDMVHWIGDSDTTVIISDQQEIINIGEFRVWLKALSTVTNPLPGIKEWQLIKIMMNKVTEDTLEKKIIEWEDTVLEEWKDHDQMIPYIEPSYVPAVPIIPTYVPYIEPFYVPAVTGRTVDISSFTVTSTAVSALDNVNTTYINGKLISDLPYA